MNNIKKYIDSFVLITLIACTAWFVHSYQVNDETKIYCFEDSEYKRMAIEKMDDTLIEAFKQIYPNYGEVRIKRRNQEQENYLQIIWDNLNSESIKVIHIK